MDSDKQHMHVEWTVTVNLSGIASSGPWEDATDSARGGEGGG